MDILTIILIVLSSVLGLLALVLLVRYLGLRAELRAFREQINEIRTTDQGCFFWCAFRRAGPGDQSAGGGASDGGQPFG